MLSLARHLPSVKSFTIIFSGIGLGTAATGIAGLIGFVGIGGICLGDGIVRFDIGGFGVGGIAGGIGVIGGLGTTITGATFCVGMGFGADVTDTDLCGIGLPMVIKVICRPLSAVGVLSTGNCVGKGLVRSP
jgi:hypothetical protein